MVAFPEKDRLHDFAWICPGVRHGPVEAFSRNKLTCWPARMAMTPEANKSAYGPSPPAQFRHLVLRLPVVGILLGKLLRFFYKPFNEDTSFGITESASQGFVVKNVNQ